MTALELSPTQLYFPIDPQTLDITPMGIVLIPAAHGQALTDQEFESLTEAMLPDAISQPGIRRY